MINFYDEGGGGKAVTPPMPSFKLELKKTTPMNEIDTFTIRRYNSALPERECVVCGLKTKAAICEDAFCAANTKLVATRTVAVFSGFGHLIAAAKKNYP